LFQNIRPGIALGRADDLVPGTARKVDITVDYEGDNHPLSVIVVRLPNGDVRVYGNRCAHFGIPLDAGEGYGFLSPDGETLRCQHHYADYALDDGRGLSRDCAGESLPRITVTLTNGMLVTT
jgi:nitrite reductase/ring-hydroxylating ferredoxin subunit